MRSCVMKGDERGAEDILQLWYSWLLTWYSWLLTWKSLWSALVWSESIVEEQERRLDYVGKANTTYSSTNQLTCAPVVCSVVNVTIRGASSGVVERSSPKDPVSAH